MKKLFLLLLLVGLYSQFGSANEPDQLNKARKSFEQKDFEEAIELYEELLDKDALSDEDRNEALYRLGVAYEMEDESRDAAYFYGEYVRINRSDVANYKTALFKAGEMNLQNATGKKDQSFSKSAIIYFSNFVELYSDDAKAEVAMEKIDLARDYIAEYHYSQFGRYYFRHDQYCGAFIAFEDSLRASEKFLDEIIDYAQSCQKDKSCRGEMKQCFDKFDLQNIQALQVIQTED